MSRLSSLADSKLFGVLATFVQVDVARLMSDVSFAAGDLVFRQGDRGDRLILVGRGELEAVREVPGAHPVCLGSIVAGEIVGELSLLGDGVRTATVRASIPTTGWALPRAAFDVLRYDATPTASAVMHAIGNQAVQRLDRLYRRCAAEMKGAPAARDSAASSIGEVSPERGELGYLAGILFFRDFTPEQIAQVTEGLPRLAVSRGALLTPAGEPPSALWVVVRGAVETKMRGTEATRSLRLAGPGRVVGHIGLLGPEAFVAGVESRARERSVLIEIPWPRVRELVADETPPSRRFAGALWTDVVRALQHGERPLSRTRATTRVHV